MEPLLTVRNLTKRYGRTPVLDDISFVLERGETLGLVGESGSGKSTLARILLRLTEPTSGQILFEGRDLLAASPTQLRTLRRRIQMVFQDPYAALNPRMSIAEILAEPFHIHRTLPRREIAGRLNRLLSDVGLNPDVLPRFPHQFSGGQRQRINIARALALDPDLLVLDEPISALDVSVGAQVVNLLRTLQSTRSLTCLFISHSMPLVRYLCDRVAVLDHGRLVEVGQAVQVCDHPAHPYTRQLLAATPQLPA